MQLITKEVDHNETDQNSTIGGGKMKWAFSGQRPIYAQLVEQIQIGILTGAYPPGSAMPSVRTLAMEAEVNPNTMQKALSGLEAKGLLYTQRTAGRFVTEDEKMVMDLKTEIAKGYVSAFLDRMAQLGIDRAEVIQMLETDAAPQAKKEVE
jgi:DNA-binding transcriptional regulator YhcF (GntR family)